VYADGFNWGDEAENASSISPVAMKNSDTTKPQAKRPGTNQGATTAKGKEKADKAPLESEVSFHLPQSGL